MFFALLFLFVFVNAAFLPDPDDGDGDLEEGNVKIGEVRRAEHIVEKTLDIKNRASLG